MAIPVLNMDTSCLSFLYPRPCVNYFLKTKVALMAIPVLNMDTSNLIELLPKLWTKAISYNSPWGANLKKNEGVMV